MRSFECLITDDRFSVRQLTWIVAQTEERACERAREELRGNCNYSMLELRENGRMLLRLSRVDPGA